MDTMRKFHWFWPWNDEQEETWLREMSGQGWHLESVALPGRYRFARGEPVDFVYRLDYFLGRADSTNYRQLFKDAGWDHVGQMGGWQYFRQEAAKDKLLEIYTDDASKVTMYQRIMLFLIILVPVLLSAMIGANVGGKTELMAVLMGILLLTFGYVFLRLSQRISQLRAKA